MKDAHARAGNPVANGVAGNFREEEAVFDPDRTFHPFESVGDALELSIGGNDGGDGGVLAIDLERGGAEDAGGGGHGNGETRGDGQREGNDDSCDKKLRRRSGLLHGVFFECGPGVDATRVYRLQASARNRKERLGGRSFLLRKTAASARRFGTAATGGVRRTGCRRRRT